MTKNITASYVSGYRDCRGCQEHSVNLALSASAVYVPIYLGAALPFVYRGGLDLAIHSEQAEQKSSALEQLRDLMAEHCLQCTKIFSVFPDKF